MGQNNAEIVTEYGIEYFRDGVSDGPIIDLFDSLDEARKRADKASKYPHLSTKIHVRTVVYGEWKRVI